MKRLFAGVVLGILVAMIGVNKDQIAMTLRPNCAGIVAHQQTTSDVVSGSFECLDQPTKQSLIVLYDVHNDKQFASLVGPAGGYDQYLGRTIGGGYIFQLNIAFNAHDRLKAIWGLNWFDFKDAWAEITGQTQNYQSSVFVYYLDSNGVISVIKVAS